MKWCALFIIVPDYKFIDFIAFLNRVNAEKLTSGNKVTLARYNCPAFTGQKWYNQALYCQKYKLISYFFAKNNSGYNEGNHHVTLELDKGYWNIARVVALWPHYTSSYFWQINKILLYIFDKQKITEFHILHAIL